MPRDGMLMFVPSRLPAFHRRSCTPTTVTICRTVGPPQIKTDLHEWSQSKHNDYASLVELYMWLNGFSVTLRWIQENGRRSSQPFPSRKKKFHAKAPNGLVRPKLLAAAPLPMAVNKSIYFAFVTEALSFLLLNYFNFLNPSLSSSSHHLLPLISLLEHSIRSIRSFSLRLELIGPPIA